MKKTTIYKDEGRAKGNHQRMVKHTGPFPTLKSNGNCRTILLWGSLNSLPSENLGGGRYSQYSETNNIFSDIDKCSDEK